MTSALAIAQVKTGEIVNLPGLSFKYSMSTSAEKSTIWRLWTDVENWKQFDTSLEYSYLVEGTGFGEGATGYLKGEGRPRVKLEIREVKPRESFIVHLKLPLWQAIDQQRYFEENEAGGTTFTHEVNFKGGLSPILYCFLRRIYKRETQMVVENLKALAEREEANGDEESQDAG